MADKFIGKRLDGRYEIHDLVGVGGMACVYRAYDRMEDRWVAIKILKEEFSNNSEFLRRFRNESKAVAMLSHPNIVKVFDVSFGDQIQYIVMEFINGITLKQYIEQERIIRWNEAVHFTSQILMALEHAHEKGIIHRDIKPQNIMLLQNGTIKVADFGIARFLESETATMTTDKAIGSVHYIAPEQARGDYITDKADIYSVGVMMYEMLTGRLPFVADSAVSVALMQLQAKPIQPRELNPSLPRGLEQITMKAMEKSPMDRFQSAGEMLDDLERFRRDPNILFHYDAQMDVSSESYRGRDVDSYDDGRYSRRRDYNDNYEYEEEYTRAQRGAKVSMVIKGIIAAVVIIGLAVGAVFLLNHWEDLTSGTAVSNEIEMPQLEGLIYQDVITNPEYTENFKFKTVEGNDPDKRPGEILKQTPERGIMVKKGREVELMVNGQITTVSVPDVSNYTQADAIALLKQYNLGYKSENVNDDEIEVGRVVSTDPAVDTEVPEGTVVTLKVSKGPAAKKVKVPDNLVGDLLPNVTSKIEDAGLKVGSITYDDNSDQPNQTVVSVSPGSGSEISEGAMVDIVVSSGKGAKKTLSTTISLPSGIDQDISLNVYRNGVHVESSTVNPAYNGSYSLSFEGTTGTETVIIELDGQKYMNINFNFDDQTTSVVESYPFVPPEPPVSSEEPPVSSEEPGGEDYPGGEITDGGGGE